jgi:23S rRNA (pseudouridine1915-N3)-methyltransferase
MRLAILAVGRMKSGPERELYDRYADRISKSGKALHFMGPDLHEIVESRAQDTQKRKSEEATQLVQLAGEGARIIVLDEKGKDLSSQEFSQLLKTEQDMGTTKLAFAIGGPDGHGDELKNVSVRKIRLGAMTWPHQIARILLAEQIYRGITILSGHPYHRE